MSLRGTICTVRNGGRRPAVEIPRTCEAVPAHLGWYERCSTEGMSNHRDDAAGSTTTEQAAGRMRKCWVVAPVVTAIEGMAPPAPIAETRPEPTPVRVAPRPAPVVPFDGVVRSPAIRLSPERAEALRLALAERARAI